MKTLSHLIAFVFLITLHPQTLLSDPHGNVTEIEALKTLISDNFFKLDVLSISEQNTLINTVFQYVLLLNDDDKEGFISSLYTLFINVCDNPQSNNTKIAGLIYLLASKFHCLAIKSKLECYGDCEALLKQNTLSGEFEKITLYEIPVYEEISLHPRSTPKDDYNPLNIPVITDEDFLATLQGSEIQVATRRQISLDYKLLRLINKYGSIKNKDLAICLLQKLVLDGANLFFRDSKGRTPLIIATERGEPELVRHLLEAAPNDFIRQAMKECWYLKKYDNHKKQYTALRSAQEKYANLSSFSLGDTPAITIEYIERYKQIITLLTPKDIHAF